MTLLALTRSGAYGHLSTSGKTNGSSNIETLFQANTREVIALVPRNGFLQFPSNYYYIAEASKENWRPIKSPRLCKI